MDEQIVLQGLTDRESPTLRMAVAAGVDFMAEQSPGPKHFLSPSSKREGRTVMRAYRLLCLAPILAFSDSNLVSEVSIPISQTRKKRLRESK